MVKDEKEQPKAEDSMWAVGEITTETQPVVFNRKTNEQFSIYAALAKILNQLEDLKKLL
jgi:hypothetical protein